MHFAGNDAWSPGAGLGSIRWSIGYHCGSKSPLAIWMMREKGDDIAIHHLRDFYYPSFLVPYSQPDEYFATMETLPSTQTATATATTIPGPFALSSWLSANAENLKPPVNNSCLYSGKDFILMAVGGPNTRNDYHSKSL